MIINETHPEITTVGIGKEEHFFIGNVGRIIKILRSSMYADPIKAIAREISCNARDAHREVGTPDLPIEIHLPNGFDSNYKIKDFGPGISPQRMSDVFLGYGNSTKNADNTQTGGFGLGAKTPFAYADQFTVTSITPNDEGVNIKRVYILYIGANESGTSRLVSEALTDEHTGTEISIDVAQKDFSRFIKATVDVCNYWTVRPTITGISSFAWDHDNRKRIISETEWELCGNGDPIIVIDGIEYPLNVYSLNLDYGSDAHEASRFGLVLRFNTGDLTLSANREQLQYDDKTISTINKRLAAVVKVLPEKITERLTGANTYLEAVSLYSAVKQSIRSMRDVKPVWKGLTVTDRLYYRPNTTNSGEVEYGWGYNIKMCSNQVKRTREHLFIDSQECIPVDPGTKIILNDTGKLHKKTIQHYIKSNADVRRVCVISAAHGNWFQVLERMASDCEAGVNPTLLGLTFMSDLPKPPAEKRLTTRGQRIKAGCYVYDRSYEPNRKQDYYWKPVDEVPDDGTFVVITGPGNKISSNGKPLSISHIDSFIKVSCDEEVYAFRDKDAGDLDNNDWTPLLDKVDEILQDKLDAEGFTLQEVAIHQSDENSLRSTLSYSDYAFIADLVKARKISEDSPLVEMVNSSERLAELAKKTKHIWNFAKAFNLNKNVEVSSNNNCKDRFNELYPMIQYITCYSRGNDFFKRVLEYIHMCDSFRKSESDKAVVLTTAAE